MQSISAKYSPNIDPVAVIIVLVLLLLGIAYAWFVRRLRNRHPDHGYTAFLVVGGNIMIAIAYGLIAGVEDAIILLVCMGAAGLPMIVEYAADHLNRRGGRQLDID